MKVFKKQFLYYCIILVLICALFKFKENLSKERMFKVMKNIDKFILKGNNNNSNKEMKLKYILQWTSVNNRPYSDIGVDHQVIKDIHCVYSNCFVTANRSYLGDYTKFDVIAFDGPEVVHMSNNSFPKKRFPNQKYVFASKHSADRYPICSDRFNGYFNWTWTYRLDSDASWSNIVVTDSENQIIGPKINMKWIKLEDMKPISKKLKEKLRKKTKAAVWFQTPFHRRSGSAKFVKHLQIELNKYDLIVDIYTDTSKLSCPLKNREKFSRIIKRDYFFYLSFEDSVADDYVTEQLLYPLQNTAVPIVYGGANYTRFMADGTYIDARELGPKMLAEKMNKLIKNPQEYRKYFKWCNHYAYYKRPETLDTNYYCRFCYLLNEKKVLKKTSYQNFRQWWNPPGRC